jgi:hypothetical protein
MAWELVMSASPEPFRPAAEAHGNFGVALLRLGWATVRLPILALLVIFEPVVKVLLAGSALLLALTAAFFVLVRPISAFPLAGMLGVAAGSVLLLALYYAILRALSA